MRKIVTGSLILTVSSFVVAAAAAAVAPAFQAHLIAAQNLDKKLFPNGKTASARM